jgi:copper(I)-binding protein
MLFNRGMDHIMVFRVMLGGLLALFITVANAGQPHQYKLGPLEIDTPWSRATPGEAPNGVIYVTVKNTGAEPDRLIDVASPAADQTQIHDMQVEGDVSSMWLIGELDIPAGQTVTLAPDHAHIMLVGLKKPLEVGQTFPLTLTFEKAGSVTVEVTVEPAGAMAPGQGS